MSFPKKVEADSDSVFRKAVEFDTRKVLLPFLRNWLDTEIEEQAHDKAKKIIKELIEKEF